MAWKPASVATFASRLISVRSAMLAINCLVATICAAQNAETELLTNASAVLSLSVERASAALPVHIQGIVTASEPHWGGRFFIQDPTGGVFVESITDPRPAPGDLLEVWGDRKST